MAGRIRDSSVQQVLASADIVDVISGYTSLRKRGATYTGLCPFHQEKTPSFSVSAEKGLYYCFGCGAGGDVVTFLKNMDNLTFVEAVERLAEKHGVALEYEEGSAPDADRRNREKRLVELLEKTTTFYQRFLWDSREGEVARRYVADRGLGRSVCEEFRVGLSPSSWRVLESRALKEGYSRRELEEAGLLVVRNDTSYDRFRGRLMFPLIDARGRVVGFGGRTLSGDTPKYLNSSEGPLYQKGRLLYGLYQARRAIAEKDEVLVVEGYTDVLALAQAQVKNVVASMGTALTESHIELMMRFSSNLVFMFDADQAGASAALRSGRVARSKGLRPLVVVLPPGKDPADVAVQGGAEEAERLVSSRISLLRYEIRRLLEEGDTSTSEGRVRAFEGVRALLSQASSPKERHEEVEAIADRLRLTPDDTGYLLRGPFKQRGGRLEQAHAVRIISAESMVEDRFLKAAVRNPAQASPLLDGLTPGHFVDPLHRAVFVELAEALASGRLEQSLRTLAGRADDVGRYTVGLIMDESLERLTPAQLEHDHLRLQDHYLNRETGAQKGRLASGELDAEGEKRLLELEVLQQSVRAALAAIEDEA
jgi:DNA primase